MKKIFIVSSSLRVGSNSEILASEFARGAKDAGNDVYFYSLKDKKINFCHGCLGCNNNFKCIQKDDITFELLERFRTSDVICFATPVYYYEMSGQLKTFIDRLNPLYGREHNFKYIYIITNCGEDDENAAKRTHDGIKGWMDCFDGLTEVNWFNSYGVNASKEILTNKILLKEVYEAGKKIK
jgi:Multimeric flavodoxin WrbA